MSKNLSLGSCGRFVQTFLNIEICHILAADSATFVKISGLAQAVKNNHKNLPLQRPCHHPKPCLQNQAYAINFLNQE